MSDGRVGGPYRFILNKRRLISVILIFYAILFLICTFIFIFLYLYSFLFL